jgi:hypothetical protein
MALACCPVRRRSPIFAAAALLRAALFFYRISPVLSRELVTTYYAYEIYYVPDG